MKRVVLAVCVIAVLLLLWRFGPFSPATPPEKAATPRTTVPPSALVPPAPEPSRGLPPERSTLADALNSPKQDIRADLRLVLDILDTFRTNLPQSGNPVGNNAEITAVLTGRNKLRLALIPIDHPAINQNGELCDRWGTPFFFHAESANRMEVRSAGPDRKMWNDDDVMLTP